MLLLLQVLLLLLQVMLLLLLLLLVRAASSDIMLMHTGDSAPRENKRVPLGSERGGGARGRAGALLIPILYL